MRTVYKQPTTIPYSLHDMSVQRIEVIGETIKLHMAYGYVETKAPHKQVDGNVLIEGADFDFCSVYLLGDSTHYDFRGRKLDFLDFLREYPSFSFEIIDELYGYHQVCYSGYLSLPEQDTFIEMNIYLTYNGNIVYETED